MIEHIRYYAYIREVQPLQLVERPCYPQYNPGAPRPQFIYGTSTKGAVTLYDSNRLWNQQSKYCCGEYCERRAWYTGAEGAKNIDVLINCCGANDSTPCVHENDWIDGAPGIQTLYFHCQTCKKNMCRHCHSVCSTIQLMIFLIICVVCCVLCVCVLCVVWCAFCYYSHKS